MSDEREKYYSKLVTSLKSHNYRDALGTIQDDLNLPAKTSYAEMEALLIFMVRKVYGKGRNTDIALMALGLLSGFDNREGNLETQQEKDMYGERREDFLRQTDYIFKQSEGKFSTYEDAEQAVRRVDKNGATKRELDTIRSTLDSTTSRVLLKVISSLYERKGTAKDYLEEAKSSLEKIAKEQNIEKINWNTDGYIKKELLPSLKHYKRLSPAPAQSKPIQKFATQNELDDSKEVVSDYRQEEVTAGVKNPESPQSSKTMTLSGELRPDATEKPPQPLPQGLEEKSKKKGNGHDDAVTESLSIIERLKRLVRRNTRAKKDKPPCHAKKRLVGVIAVLVAIIFVGMAVLPRSNTYTWSVPTSYPDKDPYSMPEQYTISAPIEGLSFLGNTNVGLTISPGCKVPLPITVIPEESSNAYLTLDSSDGNIVRAYDIKREIEAIKNPNVTEPLRSVTITVRPLPSDAASPNIELQIPIIVNYQTNLEDVMQKPVMSADKVTGSIAEPLS